MIVRTIYSPFLSLPQLFQLLIQLLIRLIVINLFFMLFLVLLVLLLRLTLLLLIFRKRGRRRFSSNFDIVRREETFVFRLFNYMTIPPTIFICLLYQYFICFLETQITDLIVLVTMLLLVRLLMIL